MTRHRWVLLAALLCAAPVAIPTPSAAQGGIERLYVLASRNQLGLHARTPEWLLLSRGLNREVVDAEGRTVSHVTDETTNRGFWHHFRTVMSEP